MFALSGGIKLNWIELVSVVCCCCDQRRGGDFGLFMECREMNKVPGRDAKETRQGMGANDLRNR